jgi:hypothetical protein
MYLPLRLYKCLNSFLRYSFDFEKTRPDLTYIRTYDFASTPKIFPPSSPPLFCLRPRYSPSWYFSKLHHSSLQKATGMPHSSTSYDFECTNICKHIDTELPPCRSQTHLTEPPSRPLLVLLKDPSSRKFSTLVYGFTSL